MGKTLIFNAKIVNENQIYRASLLIDEGKISKIFKGEVPAGLADSSKVIDATDRLLLPGVIDSHVHFREPGLTHKADIFSESRAAVAGGVTSFMDMPNTVPQTTSVELLEEKFALAAQKSLANYSFYLGATTDNLNEIKKINPSNVCGVKLFMGSSTGNMLIDDSRRLAEIFAESPALIAAHCEDNAIITANAERYKAEFGDALPMRYHPLIRSEEACYRSTALAVELARRYDSRLHVLHITTAKELSLFDSHTPLAQKKITAETCPQYLWFSNEGYDRLGADIKCNPAIKTPANRLALISAGLNSNKIDTIGSDHAPHLPAEKAGNYWQAASGTPQIQHFLPLMLELVKQGKISLEKAVEKMCHAPAELFRIEKRGFIRKGYHADLVLVDCNSQWTVEPENILSKCAWSPYTGLTFSHRVSHTFVNGNPVYENGEFVSDFRGDRLMFAR